MGSALMPTDENRVFTAIGMLQSQVSNLADRLEEVSEKSTNEHREVHIIVDAQSEAIRNLTRMVEEMKPPVESYRMKEEAIKEAIFETKDYQIKKAEARGAARLAGWLYTAAGVVGGTAVVVASKIMEWIIARPHVPVLVFIVAMLCATAAFAHGWYPMACCSNNDCRRVPCEDIAETTTGYLYDGVAFEKSAMQPSQDRWCHVCILESGSSKRGLCLFTVQGT